MWSADQRQSSCLRLPAVVGYQLGIYLELRPVFDVADYMPARRGCQFDPGGLQLWLLTACDRSICNFGKLERSGCQL